MTDDTDDNDRMERANRIREMREGRRTAATNGETDETADDEPAAEEAADADEAAEEAVGQESAGPDLDGDGTGGNDSAADADGGTIDETVDGETDDADDHGFEFDDGGTGDAPPSGRESATDASAEAAPDDAVDTGGDARPAADPAADEQIPVTSPEDAESTGGAASGDDGGDRGSPRDRAEEVLAEAGIAQSVSDADATAAVDQLRGGGRFTIPDQATTVREEDEGVVGGGTEASVAAARAAAAAGESTYAGEQTRVLEFELGAERFCLDIDYIEEIVELENMTRVPNSPSHVEGVVDLRGQVTAIINPKDALDVGDEGRGDLIIVFDSEEFEEQGHLGWVVDEVRQVTPVADEDVNESPDEDAEHINGVINREDEDEFVVWTSPDLALNSSS